MSAIMKILEWTPEYSVNIPEIDREHEVWFETVNRLHEAMLVGKGVEHLAAILAESTQSAFAHFAHEEQLMAAAGYAESAAHVEQHDEMRRMCREFGERFARGETTMTIELTLYLSDAITKHVLAFDCPMGEYLRTVSHRPEDSRSLEQ
jgi:hemerythrin